MSIIGTRPPLISETNLYELHHRARLVVGFFATRMITMQKSSYFAWIVLVIKMAVIPFIFFVEGEQTGSKGWSGKMMDISCFIKG